MKAVYTVSRTGSQPLDYIILKFRSDQGGDGSNCRVPKHRKGRQISCTTRTAYTRTRRLSCPRIPGQMTTWIIQFNGKSTQTRSHLDPVSKQSVISTLAHTAKAISDVKSLHAELNTFQGGLHEDSEHQTNRLLIIRPMHIPGCTEVEVAQVWQGVTVQLPALNTGYPE
jgi:hypothetical protein